MFSGRWVRDDPPLQKGTGVRVGNGRVWIEVSWGWLRKEGIRSGEMCGTWAWKWGKKNDVRSGKWDGGEEKKRYKTGKQADREIGSFFSGPFILLLLSLSSLSSLSSLLSKKNKNRIAKKKKTGGGQRNFLFIQSFYVLSRLFICFSDLFVHWNFLLNELQCEG